MGAERGFRRAGDLLPRPHRHPERAPQRQRRRHRARPSLRHVGCAPRPPCADRKAPPPRQARRRHHVHRPRHRRPRAVRGPQLMAPIALVAGTPIMLGAHPEFPAKNVAELIAYAKANSGKVNFTSCGTASPQHLAGELLAAEAGFKWTHVPYKGCGDALTGVLGGQVPVFISTVAHFNPQIKNAKLRGFAILSPARSSFAPDYPTLREAGYPDMQFDLWFGLMSSSRVPAAVQARLNAEVNKVLQAPDLREKL